MGLFHSKEYTREKQTQLTAQTMQTTGVIPREAEVVLSFDPKNELLVITYRKDKVTLPYQRIRRAELTTESAETESTATQVADLASSIGFGKISLAGKLSKKLLPSNTALTSILSIDYIDQDGNEAEVRFSRKQNFEHGLISDIKNERLFEEKKADRDEDVNAFEAVLQSVIARNLGKDGKHL